MFHSHLRENLAVESDVLLLSKVDKLGVGHTVLTKRVVETDDPESAEGALLGATVTASVLASLNHGFFRLGEKFLAAPAEAFGFL